MKRFPWVGVPTAVTSFPSEMPVWTCQKVMHGAEVQSVEAIFDEVEALAQVREATVDGSRTQSVNLLGILLQSLLPFPAKKKEEKQQE